MWTIAELTLKRRAQSADTTKPGLTKGRPVARGKFIFVDNQKYYVRGVTYGTFRPDANGDDFPDPLTVERDFQTIAAAGGNSVRTYTVPPRWLLDLAERHGLRVLVGLPWEQHVTFLDDQETARSIERRIREGVRSCAGHPAILAYAIGNEIPASIVRWHGRGPIERFLERLFRAVKDEDPIGLVTYVNYPSTEYLQLPFFDLVSFNVYLESPDDFEAYLARLQNLAGDRPLLLAEIGLDSQRHGEVMQALTLEWQLRATYSAGCIGMFVFAWTDEWHRGGYDVDDWDFGLTRRDRSPKLALATVRGVFAEVPFPRDGPWPRISVVVSSRNGARTIGDCCEGLSKMEYPDFEVIVVDDGSTDSTAAIASEYGFRLIQTPNRGLSSARNTGLAAASGDIVAFVDDDAYPDPHWLFYLADVFMRTSHAGVGGPNIPPSGDGRIADCVANAPGGPVSVLLTDREAEHIPGCNMAFRKECLEAIGGFDPRFCAAGDDVDICWRLRDRGWTLGFHPGAVVWHHRRNSVGAYWRQQVGYGKAEALLERKWPERYNAAGHHTWAGRLYGKGLAEALPLRPSRIYHGTWGMAPFQALYHPEAGIVESLPMMPEWYVAIVVLAAMSFFGLFWRPLILSLPVLLVAVGAPTIQAALSARRGTFAEAPRTRADCLSRYGLTFLLHLLQPLARLTGRLGSGLTLWRRHRQDSISWPWPRTFAMWSDGWHAPHDWIAAVRTELQSHQAVVLTGETFDCWDLQVCGGTLGSVRAQAAVEEHGFGKQLVRIRLWPRLSPPALVLILVYAALCIGAAMDQVHGVSVALGVIAVLVAGYMLEDCAVAMGISRRVLQRMETQDRVSRHQNDLP